MSDSIFDIIIFILIVILVITIIHGILTFKTKKEKEYERKLKESLADEFITDPETGVKLTLEEAESGKWLAHDNEFRTIPDKELNKIPVDEEKQVQIALNYLRGSRFFTKTKLNDEEINKLEDTKILSGYDDWSYSNAYKFENGFIFLPTIEGSRIETHLMMCLKIPNTEGHYLFREKTSSERFFDSIRNDDDIKLKNYECFTVKKSTNIVRVINLINKISSFDGLQIEINHNNLFIKTLKLVSEKDVKKLKKLINTIY